MCAVKDESSLLKARQKIEENGVKCAIFQESDIDNQFTALATEKFSNLLKVEADNPVLLHPQDIAEFFCDQNKEELTTCSYRIINKTKEITGTRNKIIQKACDVRYYIESQFLEGNIVSIKELHHKFQKHNVAVSTLYRHLAHVRKKLKAQNRDTIKIKVGCYKIA